MKNILVTGGCGFIGTNLCIRLLKEGNKVWSLDNLFSSRKQNLNELMKYDNFTFLKGDVCHAQDVQNAVHASQAKRIYHLACPASPPKYQKYPANTMLINVVGTFNVLTEAFHVLKGRPRRPRILLTSTSEVYGDPLEHPQKETYRGNVNSTGPRSCYDEGKRAAESLMYDFQRGDGIDIRVARIFNTYGPYMDIDDGRVVTNFIKQALDNEELTIYGDGSQTRSLCYVDDMVDGLIKLMESDYSETPVNLGNPEELSILQLANEIERIINGNFQLKQKFVKLPDDDPSQRCPDITLARNKIQWQPKVSRSEGLQKMIEYVKKELA